MPVIQDLKTQVAAGLASQSRLNQAKDALAAARDADLLNAPLSLNDLTEDRAAQLEQAALRQLDRAKARVERVRSLVEAGRASNGEFSAAPLEDQALAQNNERFDSLPYRAGPAGGRDGSNGRGDSSGKGML